MRHASGYACTDDRGVTLELPAYRSRTEDYEKLDGKVAVVTGATSGMALAGAKLFVDEGAHVFLTGPAEGRPGRRGRGSSAAT